MNNSINVKGTLVKRSSGRYDLYYANDKDQLNQVASTFDKSNGKLSISNCQMIENSYCISDIASEFAYNQSPDDSYETFAKFCFEEGFNMAIQLLGDKKFSIEDIQNVIDSNEDCLVWANVSEDGNDIKFYLDEEVLTESLQQTEWDVEIEIVGPLVYPANLPKEGEERPEYRPKLDANGCLILKRI